MRRGAVFLILLLMAVGVASARAGDAPDLPMQGFAAIPVQHQGRIKPIQSFARANLHYVAGRESLDEVSATAWLAEALFRPARARQRPVMHVRNADLVHMLELSKGKNRLYSFAAVVEAFEARQDIFQAARKVSEDKRTPLQQDLIALHQRIGAMDQILNAMTPFLPVPGSEDSLTSLELLRANAGQPENAVPESVRRAMAARERKGALNSYFRVIPDPSGEKWAAPWFVLMQAGGGQAASAVFPLWTELARSYRQGDVQAWKESAVSLQQKAGDFSAVPVRNRVLKLELVYNTFDAFLISLVLYIAALALGIWGLLRASPRLSRIAAAALGAGLGVHVLGVMMRVIIMSRPPVSTLYESVIFVGTLVAGIGLYRAWRHADRLAVVLAALGASVLHILAMAQGGGGETMLQLSAVLDTNFWLAVHVMVITAGYAFCILTGLYAHYVLWAGHLFSARGGGEEPTAFRAMNRLALMALLLTSTGTVLGGIWADQSWGRFWGWDPKENGALLIVLWLIWIIHGRISAQMSPLWATGGLAYLNVVVALSWFGVNYLGVGMHSYGFAEGEVAALGTFMVLETCVIGGLMLRADRRIKIKAGGDGT